MKIILYQSSPPLSQHALERSGYFPVSAQSANLPTLSALPPDLPRLPIFACGAAAAKADAGDATARPVGGKYTRSHLELLQGAQGIQAEEHLTGINQRFPATV